MIFFYFCEQYFFFFCKCFCLCLKNIIDKQRFIDSWFLMYKISKKAVLIDIRQRYFSCIYSCSYVHIFGRNVKLQNCKNAYTFIPFLHSYYLLCINNFFSTFWFDCYCLFPFVISAYRTNSVRQFSCSTVWTFSYLICFCHSFKIDSFPSCMSFTTGWFGYFFLWTDSHL